ncbi:hypothetical protein ACFC18_33785 [Streptomyces sp. NPDC056121]|nr:hypothetical protein [Streptomyces longhuiensis]
MLRHAELIGDLTVHHALQQNVHAQLIVSLHRRGRSDEAAAFR